MEVINATLRPTALILVLCDESTLLFSWVYTPSKPSPTTPWPSNYFVHPLLTTIMYAVLEPLASRAMLWLSVPPIFLLMAAGAMHCSAAPLCTQMLWRSATEEALIAAPAGEKSLVTADEAATPAANKPVLSSMDRYLFFLYPVVTAAGMSAALSLAAQSLLVPAQATTVVGARWDLSLKAFALLTYAATVVLTSGYGADTHRPHVLRACGWDRHTLMQGLYFALLILLRAGTRVLLGLDFTPLAAMDDKVRAVELFGPQRYEWVDLQTKNWPGWVSPAMSTSGLIVQGFGIWWTQRSLKKNSEKLERLSTARLESGSMEKRNVE